LTGTSLKHIKQHSGYAAVRKNDSDSTQRLFRCLQSLRIIGDSVPKLALLEANALCRLLLKLQGSQVKTLAKRLQSEISAFLARDVAEGDDRKQQQCEANYFAVESIQEHSYRAGK